MAITDRLAIAACVVLYALVTLYPLLGLMAESPMWASVGAIGLWLAATALFVRSLIRDRLLLALAIAAAFVVITISLGMVARGAG
jgi:hypothetical protein